MYNPTRFKQHSKEPDSMADERGKAIDLAVSQIEKQFGKGSIMRLGSKEIVPIAVISTGAISFDAALGVGGFPRGRVVEVFGPESSGKTTITLQVIAEAQKTSILRTRRNWGSMSITSWSLSPTTANKRWKSPKPWCAPMPSMCWWSIP
jgi:hypothetical protein